MDCAPNRAFPIPYQVDFSVENKGKYLNDTKRKMTWKFGFAHGPAVFPHKYDEDENYLGDDEVASVSERDYKKAADCRGREHEVILVWSLLTGKAHLYVDSKEIYRHEALDSWIFDAFTASFHKGFNLPNSRFNGKHRIDIRCYARTPIGSRNQAVNAQGGKFRQYDLSVDGLSYSDMPAVFELGTERMWRKVNRWGFNRVEPEQEANDYHGSLKGRKEDDYYAEKVNRGDPSHDRYGHSFSTQDKKAIRPKSESEEKRMIGIAREASLKDWDKEHSPNRNGSSTKKAGRTMSSKSKLGAIGEDNLIDFGDSADNGQWASGFSQIDISRRDTSDVSVLGFGDDDQTTASFLVNTSIPAGRPPAFAVPPRQPVPAPTYIAPPQQQQPRYPDPSFDPRYQQYQQGPSFDPRYQQYQQGPSFDPRYQQYQQHSSAGALSTNPNMPGVNAPSDASFAMAPPPTLDDYNNAFGGSMSVVPTASLLSPSSMSASSASVMSPQTMNLPVQSWHNQSFGTAPPPPAGYVQTSPALYNGQKPDPYRPFVSRDSFAS